MWGITGELRAIRERSPIDIEPRWIAISLLVGLVGGSIGALYPALAPRARMQ